MTETWPAGSEATETSAISATSPAPATCVGGGVGNSVGVRVGEPFELLSSPPHPDMLAATTSIRTAIVPKRRTVRVLRSAGAASLPEMHGRSTLQDIYQRPFSVTFDTPVLRIPFCRQMLRLQHH